MTTASTTASLNFVGFDPLRDKSYQQTRLGRSVVDFLAWKEIGGTAEATLDQYERDLARGCLMFPDKRLGELTDEDLLHIAKSFKPAGRPKRMAAWRSFYRWAIKTRKTRFNPCDALPDFKPPKQRIHDVFNDAEINTLCGLPIRDGALMQLLFDAGLRKAEARGLRLEDFHQQGGRTEIAIWSGKGDKDRVIPATLAVMQQVGDLAILEGINPRDHLWYGVTKTPHFERLERVKPIGEGTFARWWARCLAEAGVRYRNPHTARHTFATRYLRMGGKITLLKDAMGHESIQTTVDLYGHLDTRDLHGEFERLFS